LIQESKPDVRGTWNLPGGRVEVGESLHDATVREVREEAGLDVALSGLMFMDQLLPNGTEAPHRLRFVFRAEPLNDHLKSRADEHSLRAEWFHPSELGSLPLRNLNVLHMAELFTQSAPCLPMDSVRALTGQQRESERHQLAQRRVANGR
jgi:ADP-ribose pyrophosphatase YjhB (NUDIX family)